MEKAIVRYKEVQTTGAAKTLEVQFKAMLLYLSEVSNAQNRYITAGTQYGDSKYIWIGQAHITTKNPLTALNVRK